MSNVLFGTYLKVFVAPLLLSIIGLSCLFSCDSDKAGAYEHPGLLQFGLEADTSGIPDKVEVTKATLPELEKFLNTDQYKIEILQGEQDQVIQMFEHYKDMPEQVELERGNYRIRASMGEQKAASFDSPRFEGLSDFIIKENMTTKLDVTCSLVNARVTVAYTDSFKVVYPHYTFVLGSAHTTTDSLRYVQDEVRAGWFQVNTSGENLNGILTVKPDTGEVKQFTVTIPSVKPKDNVRLVFNSTPNTRPDQGLTVKITINDETVEKPIYMYVPDYMLPVDAALLEPHGFAHQDPIVLAKDDRVAEANIKMYVPGTIENCKLTIWQDQGQPIEYDLAHLDVTEKAVLNGLGFNLPDIWHKKQVSLDFKPVIEKLPRIPQGETSVKRYNYQLIVTDSLVNPHVSKPLTLAVKMIPDVAPKVLLSDGFISSQAIQVTEGGMVYSDGEKKDPKYVATIQSSISLSACMLKITDARGQVRQYNLKQGEAASGVKYDLSASTPFVDFKDAISALILDDENIKRYEYELTVKTELEGATYEDVKTLIVDLIPPQFDISMNGDQDENGDAFAKRAVLRAQTKTGDPSKLIFQLFENGKWVDIPTERIAGTSVKEDVASVVVTGLTPETQYRVRAKYGKHISGEKTFTTEKEMHLPESISGLEEWSYVDGPQATGLAALGGKGPYWKHWYPRLDKDESTKGWCTLNNITTQDDKYCAYESNSSTIRSTDCKSGNYAAEIRTLGWGAGTTAAAPISSIKNITSGQLFLGTVSGLNCRYGYEFRSRPTAVSFNYKYISKGVHQFTAKIILNSNDDIIGETMFNGSAQNNYVTQKVYLDYSLYKKATSISVVFISGDNTKDEVDTASISRDSEHVGNRLFVDDVYLIYE